MFNNFQAFYNFQQAYQIYSNAAQYVFNRDQHINQMITKMENEVKLRLFKLDKITADHSKLYREIENEATRFVHYKAVQENRIAILEDEVSKLKEILKETNLNQSQAAQDRRIAIVEEEVRNLKEIFKETNLNQRQIVEQPKIDIKNKVSSSTQTEKISSNDVNNIINGKKLIESLAKTDGEANQLLIPAQKTMDDCVKEFFGSKEATKLQSDSMHKLLIQVHKTNDDNTKMVRNDKEESKDNIQVESKLLNQFQENNDVDMNITCKCISKCKCSTSFAVQSENIINNNVTNASKREEKSCNTKVANLIATKGKNWNNHDINTWLEQKLNLKLQDRAWKVEVFRDYNYIQFDAANKQFLWKNREKWEEEGVWQWFEC